MNDKLCLHCGAAEVSREQVIASATPKASESWVPIPHIKLVETVEKGLANLGMRVSGQAHALTKGGDRYFGLLQVESDAHKGSDYSYVLGLRNTHDKSFNASIAAGSRVFVCDNLAFSGEIMIGRKHTTHIIRDLPVLAARAVGLLSAKWVNMDNRIAKYKVSEVSDMQAHDLLVRSLDVGAATACQLPKILAEWRAPRHPEFAESKNVWRLVNAFTEIAKENPSGMVVKRSAQMHSLFDSFVGFAPETTVSTDGLEEGAADIRYANN